MFGISKIKLWIAGLVAALVLALRHLWVVLQRDKARAERDREKRGRKAVEGARKREHKAARGKSQVKEEARENERKKQARRRSGERPSGRFNDRLRDDD